MKRFWKRAVAGPIEEGGYPVLLDGRGVKTPERRQLLLPTEALAVETAAEWAAVDQEVEPDRLPLTQLANTILDRVMTDREALVEPILAYCTSDLLLFRAPYPENLTARQSQIWDPVLHWIAQRYDAPFTTTAALLPPEQAASSVAAVDQAVRALDPWRFGLVQAATPLFGSLFLGLAFVERRIGSKEAHMAACLEELFQAENWGDDGEAAERRAGLLAEAETLRRFRDALEPSDV